MRTDYDDYLLGCRYQEVTPLSRWRFTVAYAAYQRMLKWALSDWKNVPSGRRKRIVLRWNRARSLMGLVRCGKDLAARARGGDDGSGAAGAGQREPRRPLTPQLVGCGAQSMPGSEPFPRTEIWA